ILVQEKQFPRHDFQQPVWDGKDLQGKTILLCPEQGLGDAIQFIRYADLVKQKGGRVIVWCEPQLQRLFAQVSAIDGLIVNPEDAPDFQVRAQLMSLPHLLGTTLETVPAKVPYVAPPPGWEFSLPNTPNLKVGIVWSGNPKNSENNVRSIPLELLTKLLDIPGANFYSLQKEMTADEIALLEQMPVTDLSSYLHDFADTAAAISALDLVISVDTSVAHLAGALGKPVWIFLCFVPDWRWMLQREDSPWYPTVRLFRQQKAGDWDGVCDRIKAALEHLISTRSQAQPANAASYDPPRNSPPQTPPQITGIGISWPIGITSGWGIYGLNLTLQLLQNPAWEVALLAPPSITSESLNPLHKSLLLPVIEKQKSFQELVAANSHKQISCNFRVLYGLGNNLASFGVENQITSASQVGVIFFEDTRITTEAVEKAKKYSAIVAGSN